MGFASSREHSGSVQFEAPEGTDPYAVKLIEMLAMPPVIRDAPSVDISLHVENFQKGWRRSREATSSGGTLHFGHYKASVQEDDLAELEAIMANIPYQTGIAPERWKDFYQCHAHQEARQLQC